MPGPVNTGFKPSKEKYNCPVKHCSAKPRGDDIANHFQNSANLIVLDKANKEFSNLRKPSNSSCILEKSEEFLSNLLLGESDSRKEHIKYLFQHSYSSTELPNFNSINFKCQQQRGKKRPISTVFQNFFQPKKISLSTENIANENTEVTTAIIQNLEDSIEVKSTTALGREKCHNF